MNKSEFLWKAAAHLPCNNSREMLLKSYYLTRSRHYNKKSETIKSRIYSREKMCKKCCSLWSDGHFSLKINSIKYRKNKFKKKATKISQIKMKTKKRLARKLKQLCNNVAEIKCLICKRKTKTIVTKCPKNNENNKKNIRPETLKKQSKKSKKDKTAGLKIPIKSTIQSLNTASPSISNKINSNNNTQLKQHSMKMNALTTQTKTKMHQKNSSYKRNPQVLKTEAAAKRRNMLLLANALKNRDTTNNTRTGLQNMLR